MGIGYLEGLSLEEDTPAKFKSFVAPLQQVGVGYLEGSNPEEDTPAKFKSFVAPCSRWDLLQQF